MRRGRLALLGFLLLAPLLVTCIEVDPEIENDPGPDTTTENQTDRDVMVQEGGEQDGDVASAFGGLGVVNLATTNADVSANHESDFDRGNTTLSVETTGDATDPISVQMTMSHLFSVLSTGTVPESFLFQVESFVENDIAGATVDVSTELVDELGTRTQLLDGEPFLVDVANNEPDGEDFTLESVYDISVPAGAAAGRLTVLQAYYGLPPQPRLGCPLGGDPPGPDGTGCACNDDPDCFPSQSCVDGACLPDFCVGTFECGPLRICVNGACRPIGVGQPCNGDEECGRDLSCNPEDFQLFCSECTDEVPCPDDLPCVDFLCANGPETCASDDDCEDGSRCDPVAGFCVRGEECTGRWDCDEQEYCEDGLCVVGGICEDDADCPEGTGCCQPEGMIDNLLGEEAYCDVYCIKRCENDADCVDGFCPQNGWCVSQTCPNDEIEGPEVCDGTDLEGATCESLGFVSGALGCLSDCSDFDTSSCVAPVCQDETAEGFEVCDGADLNGDGCRVAGFDGGTLGCQPDCLDYDTSACTCDGDPCAPGEACDPVTRVCIPPPVCGDGTATGVEECEPGDVGGASCTDLGFTGGTLQCDGSCGFDTSDCLCGADVCDPGLLCDGAGCVLPGPGNGVLEDGEQCEDTFDCEDLGFDPGIGDCDDDDATVRTETCLCLGETCAEGQGCGEGGCFDPVCGDGLIEPPEECDGDEFGGLGCSDFGDFDGGELLCDPLVCLILKDFCECADVVCGQGLSCVQGDCRCEPGALRCTGDRLETCDGDDFLQGIDCADGCDSDENACTPQQETEDNDDLANANPLGTLDLGTRTVIEGLIGEGDPDFFTFSLDGPAVVTLETRGDETFDTLLLLCDPVDQLCATPVAEDDDSGDGLQSLLFARLDAGEHFFILEGFEPLSSPYLLEIDVETPLCEPGEEVCSDDSILLCDDDGAGFQEIFACQITCDGTDGCQGVAESEPNDSDLQAQLLLPTPGDCTGVEGSGALGDQDWYEFTLDESLYAVMGLDSPLRFDVLDGSLDFEALAVERLEGFLDAGTYYVRVTDFQDVTPGDYSLSFCILDSACIPGEERCEEGDVEICDDPVAGFADDLSCKLGCEFLGVECLAANESEPNDGTFNADDDAGVIGLDQRFAYTGNVLNIGDSDVFAFSLESSGFFTVETGPNGVNTLDSVITLLDSVGNPIATDDDSGVDEYSRIFQPGLAPGSYFVRVGSSPGFDESGSYRLDITLESQIGNGVRTGYQVRDSLTGIIIEGDEDRGLDAATTTWLENPIGPASAFSGSVTVQRPGPLAPFPSFSGTTTVDVGESPAARIAVSSNGTVVTTVEVTSDDPNATGDVDVLFDVFYQMSFDSPIDGPPADGAFDGVWVLNALRDGAVTVGQGFAGARVTGTNVQSIFPLCPDGNVFDVIDTSSGGRLSAQIDGLCTISATVPVNATIQIEVFATANAEVSQGAAVPVPEVGTFSIPVLDVVPRSDDPTVTLSYER